MQLVLLIMKVEKESMNLDLCCVVGLQSLPEYTISHKYYYKGISYQGI